jgi:hypothetical protein
MRLETILKQTFYLFIAISLCDRCLEFLALPGDPRDIQKQFIEIGLVKLLPLSLFSEGGLVIFILSISWGVYCGIKDKEGSLNNLSVFWLMIASIFIVLSNILMLLRYLGMVVQLVRSLSKDNTISILLPYIFTIQLFLIQLGLSLPQWLVTLRTYQAIKNKFGPQNRLERNKVSS